METSGSMVRVGAYVVAVRDEEILLAHQVSPGPACGRWTLPGGGVDFGEQPRDAAAREVREETGCEARVGALLDVHSGLHVAWDGGQQQVIRLLFRGEVLGQPRATQPAEVDAVRWHPLGNLPPNITEWAEHGAAL